MKILNQLLEMHRQFVANILIKIKALKLSMVEIKKLILHPSKCLTCIPAVTVCHLIYISNITKNIFIINIIINTTTLCKFLVNFLIV